VFFWENELEGEWINVFEWIWMNLSEWNLVVSFKRFESKVSEFKDEVYESLWMIW